MLLKQVFKKSSAEKKPYYLIEDLDINCFEYFENEKVSIFYSSAIVEIALINKHIRVVVRAELYQ